MAKSRVAGKSEIKVDDAAGTLRNLSSYVDEISALGKEVQFLDVTSFADTAERVIVGIETSQEFTLMGHFDDTGTTGPDAVLAPRVGTLGTWEWYPFGTASGARKFSGEALCTRYSVIGRVKERVSFEAVMKQDGTVTVGTA